jgi:hypothetical protein
MRCTLSKPVVIHARIVPLALVRKRLAAAEDASDKFKRGRKGEVWTKADVTEQGRLVAKEKKARKDLRNRRPK